MGEYDRHLLRALGYKDWIVLEVTIKHSIYKYLDTLDILELDLNLQKFKSGSENSPIKAQLGTAFTWDFTHLGKA